MYDIYNIHRRGFRVSLKRRVYQYSITNDYEHVKHIHHNVVAYININSREAVRILRRSGLRIHLNDMYKNNNKFKGYYVSATYSKKSRLLTINKTTKSVIVKREDYES